jgi:hypothetical protein
VSRYARKVDVNQSEIVEALRAAGAWVQFLYTLGAGVPDLLVIFHEKWFFMELKTAKGRLTDDEVWWHKLCPVSVYIIRSVDEALRCIGAI